MNWIDGHLDLAYLEVCGSDLRLDPSASESNQRCVSLPALRRAHLGTVFGTIFTEPGPIDSAKPYIYPVDDVDAAEAAGLRQLAVYQQWKRQGEINIGAFLKAKQPHVACDDGKAINVVLLMEGADPIRSPDHVAHWKTQGLRLVGLTWATGTRYAGGNACALGEGPLTSIGIEMVHALDEANIIHDVSHLSDAAFDGVLEHARGRIVASHSNCRALLDPVQRHLRDDQIKAIDQRGGVVGLNLYSKFLVPQKAGRRATIADCVTHIEHVAQVMGHRRGVALGSDMDGGFGPDSLPIGLDHPTKLPALADALKARGWSDDDIAGFAHRNWQRVIDAADSSKCSSK